MLWFLYDHIYIENISEIAYFRNNSQDSCSVDFWKIRHLELYHVNPKHR